MSGKEKEIKYHYTCGKCKNGCNIVWEKEDQKLLCMKCEYKRREKRF